MSLLKICFAVTSACWIVSYLIWRNHYEDEDARLVHSFCFALVSIMLIGSTICVLLGDD